MPRQILGVACSAVHALVFFSHDLFLLPEQLSLHRGLVVDQTDAIHIALSDPDEPVFSAPFHICLTELHQDRDC